MHPPAKLLLREGFGFHSRPESLRTSDVIRTKCVRDPVAKDVKLPNGHVEECRLEGAGGDVPSAWFARCSAASARRGPEVADDGVFGKSRPSLDIGGSTSPDTLLGCVAAVPRDIEMPIGADHGDEQCPLVKRASSFVLRDGFRPYLDAFVHDLAEDDELKPGQQSRQFLVRFGEVRKDRLQGEMFHCVVSANVPTSL